MNQRSDRIGISIAVVLCVVLGQTGCVRKFLLPESSSGSSRSAQASIIPSTTQIWFVGSGGKLASVQRTLSSGNDRLAAAIRELLSGPLATEKGLGSEIPRGTLLLGVRSHGNSLELDLSRRFAASGGVESIETRLEQLYRTARSAEPDHDVYLSVEGQRLNVTQGEGIEVKQPINR